MYFEPRYILEGQKFGDALLKAAQKEDPRTALIGLAQALMVAAQANKLNRKHFFGLMETLWNALNNPAVQSAQEAMTRLIVPDVR